MASVVPQDSSAVGVFSFVSAASRYGFAVLAVAIASAVTLSIPHTAASPTNFALYIAIFVSIWFFGRGPGWFAAAIAIPSALFAVPYLLHSAYFAVALPEAITYVVIMLLCAVAADVLSSRRHRTEATLRSARDRLETAVQARTAELTNANEKLLQEIAERNRAEAALRASEEWWRAIFEASNVAIGVTDLTGRIIMANAASVRLIGYSKEELCALTITDLTHEDDRARTLPLFEDLAAGQRKDYNVDKRYCCKDGSVKWLNVTVSRVPYPKGGSDLVLAIIADITEQKRAEEALRASEERWRRVFESSAVAIALADGSRRIVAVNPACERLLGYTLEEFLMMSILGFKCGDDRAFSARMLDQLEQGLRRDFHAEMRFRRKNGQVIWVDASVSYVPPTEITPALFPAVIEDITQRKRAEFDRERLASIVEYSGDMMAICDLAGTPSYLNEAGLKMVGLSDMDQLKDRRGTHFLFREDRPFSADVVWPAIMKDGAWSGELRFRNFKTGQAVPVLYSAFRMDDPETGQPINIGAVCRDITDRKRVEVALRASEARWCAVFESASVGVATSDSNRRTTALQRMLGYSEREFQSMGWDELAHPDDAALMVGWASRLTSGQQYVYPIDIRYRHKDGGYRWCNVSASFVPPSGSGPGFFATIVIDIDDRRAAEEALRQARAELAHVARITTMGALAASIAHEINQPLTALVASANACRRWLENGRNLSRANESLGRVIGEANRASEIIKRVRSLTKKRTTENVELDMNDVIQEMLTFTRAEVEAKNVTVQTDLQRNLPRIVGDRVQLQQVLLNLIMNGIDAMSAIRDRRRVLMLKSDRDDDRVLVAVLDSGPGLVADSVDRIFDAFFTTKPDGMGMGLAISRSIVETHGGALWASPLQPRGTAFYLTLPAAQGDEQ